MFNNIIYFILALLIFNVNYPGSAPGNSFIFSLAMLLFSWMVFAGYCRWGFRVLEKRLDSLEVTYRNDGRLTGEYQGLVDRLSVLAVFLFVLAIYVFNIKYWLRAVPVLGGLSFLQGACAMALFLFYLSTIWYFAHPVHKAVFNLETSRKSYIRSNLRFNLPILFPWFALSLLYDIISLSPWDGGNFLESFQGQIIFIVCFLALLIVFLPWIIQFWWGCRPLDTSEKGRFLQAFLHEKGFKYRYLLDWPIFEGGMMTAGIMGVIPRYRYILITDSLMEILSIEELKGVLAHEMGHARYRHILFYVLFLLGFMVLSFGLSDIFFYLFYSHPYMAGMISEKDSQGANFFYLILSIPMMVTLFVYFRYVMGFFMRNFERQADLYSSVIMGTPMPTVNSLEKIAYYSGKSRDLPSWHHFSIRERVEYLMKVLGDPGVVRRHNRFVMLSFATYLICMSACCYVLNFSPLKQNLIYSFAGKAINQQLLKDPENIALYHDLATVYQRAGRYNDAVQVYEKIIVLDPKQAVALNNLAWLLVTAPDKEIRDKGRALELARAAVGQERSPIFLDTLAEALFVNGFIREAVETIREAIETAEQDKRGYYEGQLEKFLASGSE